MPATTLITGGAGFIGSHLAEALIAAGDRVVAVDDCSTGSLANLAALQGHPGFRFHHGSVCDALLMDEVMAGVDRVVHLAAAVGVLRIMERQVAGIVTNLRGTETVLQAAFSHGRKPVFLASSSEVYGKSAAVPFREEDDSVLGATGLHRWSYACAKAMDEFLALAYHRERGLPVMIGRFFNITGPRQSPAYGMVLPRFCAAAVAGRPIEVYGDGSQTRTFLHVADCVAAVRAVISCPAAAGQVVNIGGSHETAIADLARRVAALAGKPVPIRHVPYDAAYPAGFEDLRRRVPDTGRLACLTGWSAVHDLDAIIRDALAHARRPLETP